MTKYGKWIYNKYDQEYFYMAGVVTISIVKCGRYFVWKLCTPFDEYGKSKSLSTAKRQSLKRATKCVYDLCDKLKTTFIYLPDATWNPFCTECSYEMS